MKRFVLDASVVLAWFLDNPVPAYAIQIKASLLSGARAVVPALWHLEMANGLVVAERRRILAAADIAPSMSDIERLVLQAVDTISDLIPSRQALNTARAFQLSAYDAVYLDIARNESLPLATLDKALRTAAGRAEVELFHGHN